MLLLRMVSPSLQRPRPSRLLMRPPAVPLFKPAPLILLLLTRMLLFAPPKKIADPVATAPPLTVILLFEISEFFTSYQLVKPLRSLTLSFLSTSIFVFRMAVVVNPIVKQELRLFVNLFDSTP